MDTNNTIDHGGNDRSLIQVNASRSVGGGCTPASGWEKGQAENQVGLVREVLHATAAVQDLRRDERLAAG
jgi:hypothetical protein